MHNALRTWNGSHKLSSPQLNSRKSSIELWKIDIAHAPKKTMARKPKPSVRAIVKDFAERTSAHGIGMVYGSENYLWRIFWLLACIAGIGMVIYQGTTLLETYLNKPVATSLDVSYSETVSFPAVTVCNLNIIKKKKIKNFPNARQLFDLYQTMSNSNSSVNGSAFYDSKMKTAQKGRLVKSGGTSGNGDLEDVSIDTQSFLEANMIRYLALHKDTDLEKSGHMFNELIFRCVWSGFECNKGDFLQYWHHFWHWRYGNCFTFNFGLNNNGSSLPHLTSSKSGPLFGLTLDLFIDQDQYIGSLSQEAGVKVLLSNQKQIPFPTVDGFNVAPGIVAYIGIRKVQIERVDPFNNGSCFSKEELESSSIYKNYKGTAYSVQGCMNSCLATNQEQTCNCTEGKFRIKGTPCLSESELTCLNNVGKLYENGSLNCSATCPQPCDSFTFRRTISQAEWSEAYEKDFQRQVKKSTRGFDNKMHNDASVLRKNFLRLKLYFEELNLEKVTYSEYYLLENLLGDLGGQLGLWIGVSVITVAEFGKLFLDICYCFFKKLHWHSENQHVQDINMQST